MCVLLMYRFKKILQDNIIVAMNYANTVNDKLRRLEDVMRILFSGCEIEVDPVY